MEKIASFRINHRKLLRGIYVSRQDRAGEEVITTFDIRMKEPNREKVLSQGAIHTIEHIAASVAKGLLYQKELLFHGAYHSNSFHFVKLTTFVHYICVIKENF